MRRELRQPIALHVTCLWWCGEQIGAGGQHRAIGIGGAFCVFPFWRADQDHEALLRRVHHVAERCLQHRVALLHRQQRQDIGVGRDALAEPKTAVMQRQQAHYQRPAQRK